MREPSQRRNKLACAICGAAPTVRFRPFCSRRCADIDLNRWFTGQYATPVVETDDEDLDALERGGEDVEGGDAEDGEYRHRGR